MASSPKDPTEGAQPAMGTARSTTAQVQARLDEASATNRGLIETIQTIIRRDSATDLVRSTLETIRRVFDWPYAVYWTDRGQGTLGYSMESGSLDDEFQRASRATRYKSGEGLVGRAWKEREVISAAELGEADDPRAAAARRSGVRSSVAVPFISEGRCLGAMDFSAPYAADVGPAPRTPCCCSASLPVISSPSWRNNPSSRGSISSSKVLP